jgi:hypothetical protein
VRLVEQVHEQLVGLVDDLGDPGVARSTLLTTEHDRHVGVERLAEHEAGLRERALGGVDESTMPSTMDRPRSTSPPKSAWPGVSMMLIVIGLPSARGPA